MISDWRKVLALMVLMCGAASAHAAETQKWCDEDNNKIVIIQLGPISYTSEGSIAPGTFVMDGKPIDNDVTIDHTERGDDTDEEILFYDYRTFFRCR